jgi:photosynthetic reaction center H subunit
MPQYGAITSYIDVAQLTLYAFWLFFIGLVLYLRRENRREGFPLEADQPGSVHRHGMLSIPRPKAFKLTHGGTRYAPHAEAPQSVPARPAAAFPGAPLQPTGNPMLDAVGPAAYAQRADVPDTGFDDGLPKIVPLRVANDFYIAKEDNDPRGMEVVGADGIVAGTVRDVWVDRSEVILRYLEVVVPGPTGARSVLVPQPLANYDFTRGQVHVNSILAHQFADVPTTQHPDQVTHREEDRISAYYGGGKLYATPLRLGPSL